LTFITFIDQGFKNKNKTINQSIIFKNYPLIILHTSVINLKIVNLIKNNMIRIIIFYLHLQLTQRETVKQSIAIKSRINVGVRQQQIPSFLPIFVQSVLHNLAGVETCFLKLSEELE